LTPGPSKNTVRKIVLFAALCALPAARAQDFQEFSSKGLPRSEGVVVRVSHPAHWKMVEVDDEMALAELRGTRGRVTGILQVGRGQQRPDIASVCLPERARTMLQKLEGDEADARVTDVFARRHEGRPAYEVRYERRVARDFMAVRSLIVCLKDSRLLVSCGSVAPSKPALADLEPVCRQVLESVRVSED
jgi:hypothetical protein